MQRPLVVVTAEVVYVTRLFTVRGKHDIFLAVSNTLSGVSTFHMEYSM